MKTMWCTVHPVLTSPKDGYDGCMNSIHLPGVHLSLTTCRLMNQTGWVATGESQDRCWSMDDGWPSRKATRNDMMTRDK